jgi:hypothetical protein
MAPGTPFAIGPGAVAIDRWRGKAGGAQDRKK